MPWKPRKACFNFYPKDFLTDPAVEAMGDIALAAYIRLLCQAWEAHEPGVLRADPDSLACLARMSLERWSSIGHQVQEAFDSTSRPGYWIQRRMVREHSSAQSRHKTWKENGSVGGKTRVLNEKASQAQASLKRPFNRTHNTHGSHGSQEEEESPPTPRARAARSQGMEPEGFAEWYQAFPRHKARLAAARAYRAAVKQVAPAVLLSGAKAYAEETQGRAPDKIKYPASWLNGGCWLDDSSGNGPIEDEDDARHARMKRLLAEKEAEYAAKAGQSR